MNDVPRKVDLKKAMSDARLIIDAKAKKQCLLHFYEIDHAVRPTRSPLSE